MKYLSRAAFNALSVADMVPHGDRLLVEEIELEQVAHASGNFKLFLPQGAAQAEEEKNGWKLVQVVLVGDGHRMEHDEVVPMPFTPGECWFIERFTGRELSFYGTTYRIVNQVDVLLKAPDSVAASLKTEGPPVVAPTVSAEPFVATVR